MPDYSRVFIFPGNCENCSSKDEYISCKIQSNQSHNLLHGVRYKLANGIKNKTAFQKIKDHLFDIFV